MERSSVPKRKRTGSSTATRNGEPTGAHTNPIVVKELEDDNDDVISLSGGSDDEIEEVADEDQDELEDAADEDQDELRELSESEFTRRMKFKSCAIPENHELVKFAPLGAGHQLKLRDGVEFEVNEFMRVVQILRNKALGFRPEAFTLRGILMRRARHMDKMFPRCVCELVATIWAESGDDRPDFVRGLEDRPLTSVLCVREIVFTNANFPSYSFRVIEGAEKFSKVTQNNAGQYYGPTFDLLKADAEARLVCRWKSVQEYITKGSKHDLRLEKLCRLSPEEADESRRKSRVELYNEYHFRLLEAEKEAKDEKSKVAREEVKVRAKLTEASITPGRPSSFITIEDSDDDCVVACRKKKRTMLPRDTILPREFTITDLFCGGGGASEGAKMADLRVKYAVDLKPCAVDTHRHNNPKCKTLLMDVGDFLIGAAKLVVHICHASYPCQYWSPQHTVAGRNDEANIAASFGVECAAKKTRCRIMTFEQTPGLNRTKKHRQHWHLFLNQFTSMGFDVVWKVINLAELSNPNARKRLIIFASCPGQLLPDFPEPTHGIGLGLKPYVTVNDAIKDIPVRATWHNPQEERRRQRAASSRKSDGIADGNKPLRILIDTKGPKLMHPDGDRAFTVREAMRLQTIPDSCELIASSRTEAMTMIGNAVPPRPMAKLFEKCKQALRQTDAEIAAYEAPVLEPDSD